MRVERLALLVRSLEGGGMQRNLVNLARALLARGFALDVLTADPCGPARGELPREARIHSLVCGLGRRGAWALARCLPEAGILDRLALRFGPVPRLVGALPDLLRRLSALAPDALLAFGTQANLAALLAATRLRQRPRIVASEHNVMSRVRDLAPRHFRRLYPALARRLYPSADAVVAVFAAVADDLARLTDLLRERIRIVPNPVDLTAIAAGATVPLPADWPPDRDFLLAVGRLHWQKGFEAAIAAFARLAAQNPKLDLVVLGEGPERARLRHLARAAGLGGRVHLRGFDPNPFRWMARARALLLTSRSEGFGHVVVEALACGCPIVAFDCPGAIPFILAGGRYGVLVPENDVEAMAAALEVLALSPPERELLRARARDFALAPVIDDYCALLRGVA